MKRINELKAKDKISVIAIIGCQGLGIKQVSHDKRINKSKARSKINVIAIVRCQRPWIKQTPHQRINELEARDKQTRSQLKTKR